ncbi:MAG: ATP-binding protein [Promethearchaeota archaeon]
MEEVEQSKKVKRKIIKIDEDLCTGCGKCVIACSEGALAIIDGKAKVVNEVFCDGLGACIGECPEGALIIEEREAYEFDEKAVEKYLEKLKEQEDLKTILSNTDNNQQSHKFQCNCPSSDPLTFEEEYVDSENSREIKSALRQWPTKLTLVNPDAPYFNNKELLIISDCSPIAYGDFHRKILKGKPLITLCPMLGLGEVELEKLEKILKINPIEKIKLILMEVPCCQKIKFFLSAIINNINRPILVEDIIISREGKIIKKAKI